jgi:hypothetical protein
VFSSYFAARTQIILHRDVRFRVVQIDPPVWFLNADCPCGGEAGPDFCACSKCGSVVLICGEFGDVFCINGLQRGPIIGSIHGEQACQKCDQTMYVDFRCATSDEVRALGFRWPEDYG